LPIHAEVQAYARANISVVRRPNSAKARAAASRIAALDAEIAADSGVESGDTTGRLADALGVDRQTAMDLRAQVTGLPDLLAHRAGEQLRLSELLDIPNDAAYRKRFAGTPLLRPGRAAMTRNACIAAANTGARELLPRLRRLAGSANAVIREHARWAVEQLASE
jgi:hypothetical protein